MRWIDEESSFAEVFQEGHSMDVIGFIEGFGPVQQALIAGLFTWFSTAAGAALVIFFKELDRKVLDAMLGFAAGVMIAASFWSLLSPSLEMSEGKDLPVWFPCLLYTSDAADE